MYLPCTRKNHNISWQPKPPFPPYWRAKKGPHVQTTTALQCAIPLWGRATSYIVYSTPIPTYTYTPMYTHMYQTCNSVRAGQGTRTPRGLYFLFVYKLVFGGKRGMTKTEGRGEEPVRLVRLLRSISFQRCIFLCGVRESVWYHFPHCLFLLLCLFARGLVNWSNKSLSLSLSQDGRNLMDIRAAGAGDYGQINTREKRKGAIGREGAGGFFLFLMLCRRLRWNH